MEVKAQEMIMGTSCPRAKLIPDRDWTMRREESSGGKDKEGHEDDELPVKKTIGKCCKCWEKKSTLRPLTVRAQSKSIRSGRLGRRVAAMLHGRLPTYTDDGQQIN